MPGKLGGAHISVVRNQDAGSPSLTPADASPQRTIVQGANIATGSYATFAGVTSSTKPQAHRVSPQGRRPAVSDRSLNHCWDVRRFEEEQILRRKPQREQTLYGTWENRKAYQIVAVRLIMTRRSSIRIAGRGSNVRGDSGIVAVRHSAVKVARLVLNDIPRTVGRIEESGSGCTARKEGPTHTTVLIDRCGGGRVVRAPSRGGDGDVAAVIAF